MKTLSTTLIGEIDALDTYPGRSMPPSAPMDPGHATVLAAASAALIAGASAIAIEVIKRSPWREKTSVTTIRDVTEVYDILKEFRMDCGAMRAFISVTSNGDGIPSPMNRIYTSMLYESCSDTASQMHVDYSEPTVIDEVGTRVMAQLCTDGHIVTRDIENVPLGPYRSVLEKHGIISAVRFELLRTIQQVSVCGLHCDHPMTDRELSMAMASIEFVKAKVKSIFKRHR